MLFLPHSWNEGYTLGISEVQEHLVRCGGLRHSMSIGAGRAERPPVGFGGRVSEP